jgi:hypothetical protein
MAMNDLKGFITDEFQKSFPDPQQVASGNDKRPNPERSCFLSKGAFCEADKKNTVFLPKPVQKGKNMCFGTANIAAGYHMHYPHQEHRLRISS